MALGETRQDNLVESCSLGWPSTEAVTSEAGLPEEALQRRTRRPTAGDRAIVRAQWDVACQNRCLALHTSGAGGGEWCHSGRTLRMKNRVLQ